jgi:hypothetical protein
MRRRIVEMAFLGAMSLGACASGKARMTVSAKQESQPMNGVTSPSGDKHPGEILHEDKTEGRTWTKKAAEVPQTIAWVEVGGAWKAVVKIEITGTRERRCITKFGAGGEMLETTIAPSSPPPPPRAETPVPVPVPSDK